MKNKTKQTILKAMGILAIILGLLALILIIYKVYTLNCEEKLNTTETMRLIGKGEEVTVQDLKEETKSNIADANNRFALDFYSRYKLKDENMFFSPLGISTAMAMVYEGAKGQTADEIQSVFYFQEVGNQRRLDYKNLFDTINRKDKGYELYLANAIWIQQDYPILSDYLESIGQYYGGKVASLDFIQNPKGSSVEINNWISQQTNSRIRNVVSSDSITNLTRMILTNAVYFKADWVEKFNRDYTEKQNFTITPNKVVKVQMMQLWATEFKYAENDILQILEMPYVGEDVSMLILLTKDDIATLENSITVGSLSEWRKSMEKQYVDVFIPKFDFKISYSLKADLEEMGMPLALSPSADFFGITNNQGFMLTDAIHQTFIKVNEEGTEAGAVTSIEASEASPPPKVRAIFRADHPFIFLIQDIETGNIIFMGGVVDPRG